MDSQIIRRMKIDKDIKVHVLKLVDNNWKLLRYKKHILLARNNKIITISKTCSDRRALNNIKTMCN